MSKPDGVVFSSFNGVDEWVGKTDRQDEFVVLGRVATTTREEALKRYQRFKYTR